jgi:hypothetical protein
LTKAFAKIYNHAEDSEMDKRQLFWEAAEASGDDPYLNRQVHLAELDRLGYDEKYKAWWLAKYNRQNGLDGHV